MMRRVLLMCNYVLNHLIIKIKTISLFSKSKNTPVLTNIDFK